MRVKYWIDTEFIARPYSIDLISIGLVAEDGREFYAESSEVDWSRASRWTLQTVRPLLEGGAMSQEEISYGVRRFIYGLSTHVDSAQMIEGAVNVNGQRLKPGQQASFTNSLTIRDADPDEAIAWKEGNFLYEQEPLESIMRKVSRWYDVDVIYPDQKITEAFGAGTAAVVSPIRCIGIDDHDYNLPVVGEIGSVANTLKDALDDIRYGRAEDRHGWNYFI